MNIEIEVIKTDIYPTRYLALENEGKWVVFEEADDGTYQSCYEGSRFPRSYLGAGVTYPGEMAVLAITRPNNQFPHHSDYFYINIGYWRKGSSNLEGFVAECSFIPLGNSDFRTRRSQCNIQGESIEDAMRKAEVWIREVRL